MSPNDTQADVVAFLADPASHGLGPGGVRHIRTHISDLFLAGELAYKLKRAVAYAFVDFTALAARRRACEAEIALNRRTAPEIYLRVAAVRRDDSGRLDIDGAEAPAPGTPVDWLVVLRRFDEALTFDRLAERGAIEPAHIDAIVDAALAFQSASNPIHDPSFGGAAALARVIAENAADMASLPASFPPDVAAALTVASKTALAAVAGLLDHRREDGFVRRCHGDLHLGNIVLWQDRPVLFDCIEFSEDIATIDAAYDIAFLLMDLSLRGLTVFANRALARYVGRTGDTGFLAALPLMMAMRALVRAKVTAMAMAKAGKDEVPGLSSHLRALTTLASRFLTPAPAPRLVAVGGLSGSGKSTLAATLAPRIGRAPGALLVRSDVIRKRLAGLAPEQRLPADAYTPAANEAVYTALRTDAEAALAAGSSVVVDAVFARPEERGRVAAIAREAGVAFDGLWLSAPPDVLMSRVSARRRDASDATADVVEGQLGFEIGVMDWNEIDASGPPPEVLARCRTRLRLEDPD